VFREYARSQNQPRTWFPDCAARIPEWVDREALYPAHFPRDALKRAPRKKFNPPAFSSAYTSPVSIKGRRSVHQAKRDRDAV